jgi:MFS family permease
LLTFLFLTPSSLYLNDYLRNERGFSGVMLTLFTVLTTLPAGISIVAGGRLADVFGRRVIGAIGVGAGALFTVLLYASGSWMIWLFSTVGTILGALAIPALGVYGPELFPTRSRGIANGGINVLQVIGSVIGILLVGYLADRVGYSQPMALLGLGPLLVVGIILLLYPETAHRELEDINPEDVRPPESLDELAELEEELDELEHDHESDHGVPRRGGHGHGHAPAPGHHDGPPAGVAPEA